MDHEHKEIDARARAEVAMGRDGRYDRSAFAHGPSHHLDHASSPPFPPPPCPPPFRPLVRHRIDREVARPAGRSVDAAPLAPPASVGRNVYHAAAAAHVPCAPRAASRLSARSFIPWPACARMCWNRTVLPSRSARTSRRAARALLLRSTSALTLELFELNRRKLLPKRVHSLPRAPD